MSIHSFPANPAGLHMTGTTWQHRLDAARTPEDVIAASRDYLAGFDPFELQALPPDCRAPAKIVDVDDVSSYAFELVRHECAERDETGELVHRLARFFSHASMRLAQLTARETGIEARGRESA